MEALYSDLKTRYGHANIILTPLNSIEIHFSKAKEPIIIEKEPSLNRYTVSYPKEIHTHKGTKTEYVTAYHILFEGLLWILKKVRKNGKVLPEI